MSKEKKIKGSKKPLKTYFKQFNWCVLVGYVILLIPVCFGWWFVPIIYFALVGLYLFLRSSQANVLYSILKDNSVLIAGAKGSGKDLLTQGFIVKKKPNYYSNMNYGYKFNSLDFKDISLSPNSYENFINGNIEKISNYGIKEGSHVIISDAGVYLPSQYDTLLSKKYTGMPIYFALSRHLSNSPILVNTQAEGRVWVKLREQFDRYILCKHSTNKAMLKLLKFFPLLDRYIFVECYYYEQLESFKCKLMPFDKSGVMSRNNALYSTTADTLKKTYDFEHGKIVRYVCPIQLKKIKYDTRHFRDLLLEPVRTDNLA